MEQYVLPMNFGEKFKEAIYPIKESDGEEAAIECLIDGIANCCRRKPENALGVIFDCCSNVKNTADPEKLVKLCYSLTVASRILVSKQIDEKRVKSFPNELPSLHGLFNSLKKRSDSPEVTKEVFIQWGIEAVPFIYSCLTTFTHNIIFHGKSTKPHPESTYVHPKLLDASDILKENACYTFTICCMAPNMGGKVSLGENRMQLTSLNQTVFNTFSFLILFPSGSASSQQK